MKEERERDREKKRDKRGQKYTVQKIKKEKACLLCV